MFRKKQNKNFNSISLAAATERKRTTWLKIWLPDYLRERQLILNIGLEGLIVFIDCIGELAEQSVEQTRLLAGVQRLIFVGIAGQIVDLWRFQFVCVLRCTPAHELAPELVL